MSSTSSQIIAQSAAPEWLQLVRGKVESLSYGVVQIVVHDNQVTQIERTEKTRFDSSKHEQLRITRAPEFLPTDSNRRP